SSYQMGRRMCVVCHLQRDQREMHIFTEDPNKMILWVHAVRATPERRRDLIGLLNMEGARRYLCASHFSPADYDHTEYSAVLRRDAVPFYQDPTVTSKGGQELMPSSTNATSEVKKNPVKIKNEPIDELAEIGQPIAAVVRPSTGISRPRNQSATVAKMEDVNPVASKKLLKCFNCMQSFSSLATRNNHIHTAHTIKSYMCITCDERFTGNDVWQHLRENKGHRIMNEQEQKTLSQKERLTRRSKRKMESNAVMEIEVPEMVVVKGSNKRKTKYQRVDINEPSSVNEVGLLQNFDESNKMGRGTVPNQQSYPLFEKVVKEEEIEDEEPGPSSART
ncbi:hypothetical protein PMAYCL1PPCAC_01560, partial [Pristionchus mayeri]